MCEWLFVLNIVVDVEAKQKIIPNSFNGVLSGTVFHSGAYFVIMISRFTNKHTRMHEGSVVHKSLAMNWSQSPFASTQNTVSKHWIKPAQSGRTNFSVNESEQEAKKNRDQYRIYYFYILLVALTSTFLSSAAHGTFNRLNVIWLEGFPPFQMMDRKLRLARVMADVANVPLKASWFLSKTLLESPPQVFSCINYSQKTFPCHVLNRSPCCSPSQLTRIIKPFFRRCDYGRHMRHPTIFRWHDGEKENEVIKYLISQNWENWNEAKREGRKVDWIGLSCRWRAKWKEVKLHNSSFAEKKRKMRKSHKYLKMLLIESFLSIFLLSVIKGRNWGRLSYVEPVTIGGYWKKRSSTTTLVVKLWGYYVNFPGIFHPINISAHFSLPFSWIVDKRVENSRSSKGVFHKKIFLKASKIDKNENKQQ